MATVVVEKLQSLDYVPGCVALSSDYGSDAWEDRPEVRAIRAAVFRALDTLEEKTDIGNRVRDRHVLVKPNLVLVYYYMGTVNPISPETTDPRVLDAVVQWLSARASHVTIVESSGRGSPTWSSFKISGIDRLARKRGCSLVALEEQPVDRYILPQAEVHREILIPKIFSEVVRGNAAYISVPKLKTNLYTEVTLGFKNAMGVIPYNLRQRNHNSLIERKLVEMLYLFQPDFTLIDGVVGGEGECPAPVDPVDSRMIIAGDHTVETDRAATRLMGFDPSTIKLLQVADELGFGSPEQTEVIGDATPVSFRPADASLISAMVQEEFPSLTFLLGIAKVDPALPKNRDFVRAMEKVCRGGCIATIRFGLGMLKAEGVEIRNPAVIIIGGGIDSGDGVFWYDGEGRAYSRENILKLPGKKVVIGSCGETLAEAVDYYVPGCIPFPNSPHSILHTLAGQSCRVLSLRNKQLFKLAGAMLKTRSVRRGLIKRGVPLDVPMQMVDAVVPVRELTEEETKQDWIEWPLPELSRAERKQALAFEDDSAASSFIGPRKTHFVGKLFWKSQAWTTFIITIGPLFLGLLSAVIGAPIGFSASTWLWIYLAIELLHLAELPFSLSTAKKFGLPLFPMFLRTLLMGYPAWVPFRLGIFKASKKG